MKNLINPKWSKAGYIQIYTGEGKGKTTAAIGLACRALGQNMKVLIMQFCKNNNDSGEYKCLTRNNKNLTYKCCGIDKFPLVSNIATEDKDKAALGWEYVVWNEKQYNLIILDELNIAIDLKIINIKNILYFLENKPKDLEVVITGRNAHPDIIKMAHLVTEMKPIKHYWDIGVKGRCGIEY